MIQRVQRLRDFGIYRDFAGDEASGVPVFKKRNLMQHFFPVMDAIKRRIDAEDLEGALQQTVIFERQINEIKALAPKA